MAKSRQAELELIELNEKARQHLGLYMLMSDKTLLDVCEGALGLNYDKYMLEKFLFSFIDVSEELVKRIMNLKVVNVHAGFDDVPITTNVVNDFIDFLEYQHSKLG